MQFLSKRNPRSARILETDETRSKVALLFQGWVKKNLRGREGPESSGKIFIPFSLILGSSSKRLLSNFLRVWRQSGEKLVDLWVPSGLFLPSFSRRHPVVVLLPSICGSIQDQARNAAGPWIRGSSGGTRCQADRNYQ